MTGSQTNLAWDTLIELDGAGPLYGRLEKALRRAIRAGRIPTGSALPPSRLLATELGCSRWAVTQAYAQLAAEGYLAARTGSATRVRWTGDSAPDVPRPAAAAATPRYDLVPGLPDLRAFPRRRWLDAVGRAVSTTAHADLGYPPPRGVPALREVLVEYLQRCRGASATELLVCAGVSDGVLRVCRALAGRGARRIAVEDPGWPRLRDAATTAGLEVIAVPVDESGLDTAQLGPGIDAVIVTPAHHFPTGVVLAPERRMALVEWARRTGGLIIEDDYDAEFRYDRRPIGALQGMEPGHTVLCGSVSKTLSPAVGIGWMLAPASWAAELEPQQPGGPAVLDQLTYAEFVRSGEYDRHLRAVRRRYRSRRDALVAALATALPDYRVTGTAAGLHVLVRLPAGSDPATVVAAAAARGLAVADLARYRIRPSADSGLVLGYGNLADRSLPAAVAALVDAARATS
ncbi:MAG TPA: PLP-dependent aminotransferase family protein [Mycobacteriales bacterium]|nr:PLP-dependent aminotransferase family protein [Mycobacteriales bacterium]